MNKQQFEDFKKRLTGHHREYVDNMCTASPVYEIQVKKILWGFEQEYSEVSALYCSCDEVEYFTLEDFYEDEDWILHVLDDTKWFGDVEKFKKDHSTLEDIADFFNENETTKYNGWQMMYGNERWETLYTHLTKKSADEYLAAKNSYYGEDIRLYVNSLYRNNETKDLLDLIMDGKLVFVDNNEKGE